MIADERIFSKPIRGLNRKDVCMVRMRCLMLALCVLLLGCTHGTAPPTQLAISGNDRTDHYISKVFNPLMKPNGLFGLLFDADGNLYVLSRLDHEVHVYNPSGLLVNRIGQYGVGGGSLNHPKSISIEKDKLYVLDYSNPRVERIQIFTLAGDYVNYVEFPVFAVSDMSVINDHIYLSTMNNHYGVVHINPNGEISHFGRYLSGGVTACQDEIIFFNTSVPQLKWYHHLGPWTEVFSKIVWFPPADGGQGIWKLQPHSIEMVFGFPGRNRAYDIHYSPYDSYFYVLLNGVEIHRYDSTWNYIDTIYVEANEDITWNYICVNQNGEIYLGSRSRNEMMIIAKRDAWSIPPISDVAGGITNTDHGK